MDTLRGAYRRVASNTWNAFRGINFRPDRQPSDRDSDKQMTCAICLAEVKKPQRARLDPCQHTFHYTCVDTWLSKSSTCPVCRSATAKILYKLDRRAGPREKLVNSLPPHQAFERSSFVDSQMQADVAQIRLNMAAYINARVRRPYSVTSTQLVDHTLVTRRNGIFDVDEDEEGPYVYHEAFTAHYTQDELDDESPDVLFNFMMSLPLPRRSVRVLETSDSSTSTEV